MSNRAPRPRLERVRITKVGVWYILLALVVGVAAANTGNNALYLVESLLLAVLAVSGILSKRNLSRLRLEFGAPPEAHAGQVFSVPLAVANQDRWLGRRLLKVGGIDEAEDTLIPFLPRRGSRNGRFAFLIKRRGRHRFPYLRVSSVFPLGLFDKAMRFPVELEVLVFPEIYPAAGMEFVDPGRAGDDPSRRIGWSHELRRLREFQPGDDPRGIHWKRTARTGELIYMEREAEHGRRLSIVLDNAVGPLEDLPAEERFERLVSEAASAAEHYLDLGFDVALRTREDEIPFGRGRHQRQRLLTALAVVEAVSRRPAPLWRGRTGSAELRLGWAEPPGPEASGQARRWAS